MKYMFYIIQSKAGMLPDVGIYTYTMISFFYGNHADAVLTNAEIGLLLMMSSLEKRGVDFWYKETGLVTWRQLGHGRERA